MASVVTAKFDFNAEGKGELGLKQGESLMVLKRDGEWLFGANSSGAEGWFPSNYTKEPAASPPAAGRADGGFGGDGSGGAGANPFDGGAGGQGGEADDIASLIAQIDAATVSTPTTTFSTPAAPSSTSTSIAGDTEKGPADGSGGGPVIAVAGETAEEAEAAEAARAKVIRKAGEKAKRLMKCVDEFLKTERDYCRDLEHFRTTFIETFPVKKKRGKVVGPETSDLLDQVRREKREVEEK